MNTSAAMFFVEAMFSSIVLAVIIAALEASICLRQAMKSFTRT
jgi:hypothetical protein